MQSTRTTSGRAGSVRAAAHLSWSCSGAVGSSSSCTAILRLPVTISRRERTGAIQLRLTCAVVPPG
jgi:hypothetical protein